MKVYSFTRTRSGIDLFILEEKDLEYLICLLTNNLKQFFLIFVCLF